jgi:putative ABC transport system substrate-binding protein
MPLDRLPSRVRLSAGAGCLVAALLAFVSSSPPSDADAVSAAAGGSGTLTVGVLQMVPNTLIDQTVAAFEAELRKAVAPRKVSFDLKDADGQQTLIEESARTFARSSDDMFAVIGTPAVIAMAHVEKRRPVIAIAMGDPVGAQVAHSLNRPGTNVTGSIDFVNPSQLLTVIAGSSPTPKRIGTIYDPSNENSQVWVKDLKAAASARRMSVSPVTIASSGDIAAAARSLVGRADALLIGPDATVVADLPPVAAVARDNKLPLYLAAGDLSPGVVASLGPDYTAIGRQTGDVAATVAKGANPANVAFSRPAKLAPQVNRQAVTALGIKLSPALTAAG